jgi:hypothetical protein
MKRKNVRIRRVVAQQSQASIAVFSVKRWKQHLTLIVAADTPDVRVRLTKIDVGLASMWHKRREHEITCEIVGPIFGNDVRDARRMFKLGE